MGEEAFLRNKKQSLEKLSEHGFTPDLIIDVGAAAGTDGLYEVWPECHTILIELLDHFKNDLAVLKNNLRSAEQLIRAVGSSQGIVTYHYDRHHPHRVSFQSTSPEGWKTAEVEMITLDTLLTSNLNASAARKIVLKIDVDGPEIDVLRGAGNLLERECAVLIETPLHDRRASRFTDIAIYMRDHGYEIWDIIEPIYRPSDKALWQVDSVFLPRDHAIRSDILYS